MKTPNSSIDKTVKAVPVKTDNVNTIPAEVNPIGYNPKTVDSFDVPFAVGLIGGIAALIGLNVKRRKLSSDKEDKQ